MSHTRRSEISVWVVKDDNSYRRTLVYLLNRTSDLRCDRVFQSIEEVQASLEKKRVRGPTGRGPDVEVPDVAVMDINLTGRNGIEGIHYLKSVLPDVPILVLTIEDESATIFEAFRAGASGYLLKTTPLDEVILALRVAHRGGTLMPAAVACKALRFFTEAQTLPDDLTPRELEVLSLMSEGQSKKQIAETLLISLHTVDNHSRHIYRKLNVHSAAAAVAKAVRAGCL